MVAVAPEPETVAMAGLLDVKLDSAVLLRVVDDADSGGRVPRLRDDERCVLRGSALTKLISLVTVTASPSRTSCRSAR